MFVRPFRIRSLTQSTGRSRLNLTGYPDAALDLARNLTAIQEYLKSPDVPKAVAALNEAADSLFPLTRFHKGAYHLYCTFIGGRATRAEPTGLLAAAATTTLVCGFRHKVKLAYS